uniref:Centrosomal protein 55 n=1 Tax=Anolis carolinensis TaxID=28377 RepID=A0A803SXC3_ANOCA
MTSKATKEMTTCISKWGLKSGNSKSESELQVYKKENAALKKSLEEIIKGKSKMTPEERKRLLEKILALQTETEKYKNILGERDHEIQLLKDKLKSGKQNSDTASLHSQLEEKSKEMAKREQLLKSLSEEVNRLNSQLSAVTARYSDLENRQTLSTLFLHVSFSNFIILFTPKALDKNQQWLLYDQQREVYVQGLLARIFELEQQAKEAKPEAHTAPNSKKIMWDFIQLYGRENKQRYYEQLLATVRNDLQAERRNVSQLHSDLNEVKRKYDEAKQEVMNLNSLQKQHKQFDVKTLQDENHIKGQIIQRLTHENDAMQEKLDEERKRTQTLSSQVEMLHRSLIKQQEENTRMATLEQQIQACTLDFENEKLDRHNLQHQLNKVLKELRKAREQITRLEPSLVEFLLTNKCSSPKRSNLLDESFLECPKCKAQYPTSQHRELLAHIDFCAD